MKEFTAIIVLLLFVIVAKGQVRKDSLPPYDYLEKKENVSRITVNPIQIKGVKDSSLVVVIDRKIYRAGDSRLRHYPVKNLTLLEKIVDSSSISGIRTIIIYKSN